MAESPINTAKMLLTVAEASPTSDLAQKTLVLNRQQRDSARPNRPARSATPPMHWPNGSRTEQPTHKPYENAGAGAPARGSSPTCSRFYSAAPRIKKRPADGPPGPSPARGSSPTKIIVSMKPKSNGRWRPVTRQEPCPAVNTPIGAHGRQTESCCALHARRPAPTPAGMRPGRNDRNGGTIYTFDQAGRNGAPRPRKTKTAKAHSGSAPNGLDAAAKRFAAAMTPERRRVGHGGSGVGRRRLTNCRPAGRRRPICEP